MESLQPKLRFQEFSGDWEKKKFSKYIKLYRGSSPRPIIKFVTDSEFGVNWIKIGDTKNNDNYIIEKVSEKITLEGAKHSRKVDIGEIILANSMSFGKSYILNLSGCIYDGWFVLREYETFFNKLFLIQLLNSDLLQDQYKTLSTGGVVQNISSEIVYSTILSKPSIQEQTKIANFLTSIDEKLNLLKEKKSLLEYYKKGIMQKIFNQEIRFKDDNGNDFEDWEIKTLGEVADFFKGKGLPKNHIKDDGSFKCIHYGELFTKYNELIKNVISKTDIYDKPFLSIANDVLMPTSDVTPNGLATASCILEDGVILGGDVLIIRQKKKVLDGLFLSFYIAQFREKVMKLVSGSTVYHLYGSDMKNLEIFIPCLKEQTKIATFLSAIDDKIELVSNQIQDTQEYKKGLLQKMFV